MDTINYGSPSAFDVKGSNDQNKFLTTKKHEYVPKKASFRHDTGSNGQVLVSEGFLVDKEVTVANGERPLKTSSRIKILKIGFGRTNQLLLDYQPVSKDEHELLDWVQQEHQASCYYKLPQFIDGKRWKRGL